MTGQMHARILNEALAIPLTPPAPDGTTSFIASSTTGNTVDTTTLPVPVPNGLKPYDVVVVRLSRWISPGSPSLIVPSDLAFVSRGQVTANSATQGLSTFIKRVGGAELASGGNWSFVSPASYWSTGQCQVYRGVDRDADLATLRINEAVADTGQTVIPSVTLNTVPAGSALDWHGVNESGGGSKSGYGSFTETQDNDCDAAAYQVNVGAANYTLSGVAVSVSSASVIGSLLELPAEPSSGLSAALATATETDSAIALAGITKKLVSPVATETDTARAVAAITKKLLSPTATETDSALAIGHYRTRTPAVATETDTAIVLGRISQMLVPVTNETDTAQALGRISRTTVPIATETDLPRTITPLVSGPSVATEVDTAQPTGARSTLVVPIANEADVARAIVRVHAHVLAVATTTDTAQAIARISTRVIPVVNETDTAQAMGRGSTLLVPIATETDTARSLAARKTRALSIATEADSARVVSRFKVRILGTALEVDTALVFVRKKRMLLVPAIEVDQARTIATGPLVFIDISLTVGSTRKREFATVLETRRGVDVEDTRKSLIVGGTRNREHFRLGELRERPKLSTGETRQGMQVKETRQDLDVGDIRRDR